MILPIRNDRRRHEAGAHVLRTDTPYALAAAGRQARNQATAERKPNMTANKRVTDSAPRRRMRPSGTRPPATETDRTQEGAGSSPASSIARNSRPLRGFRAF